MCGRLGRPDLTWAQLYAIQRGFLDAMELQRNADASEPPMSWNVKPTQPLAMAFHHEGQLITSTARWWFVPHWFKGEPRDWKATTFNAKLETAAERPTFRAAWPRNRCIIPASFYYEWTGRKGAKQPWLISTDSNSPMFFAGLHSRVSSGLRTCTILTRAALPQIAHIHDRTPVILSAEALAPWLKGEIDGPEAQDLGKSWDGRMQFRKVAPFGRDDDGPELIEPFMPS
ncbi:SOS response-associated peptidase [Roseobacteraceae bacterium NS-SX3]